ncbi:MAG: cation diffusion facilitator family transporter [Pseudomonadota bacterium]
MAAFFVIVVFMVVEVIGGVISGSLALLADAVHMMTDAVALGFAASAQWFASRPADARCHFGYGRVQVLAAFVNGILLSVLLIWIVFEAMNRFLTPQEVAWRPMLAIAVLGLIANAVAFRILHASSAGNINVRGALLHVVSDFVGSVAAVLAALSIAAFGAYWVDPLLSIAVAALIAQSAARLLAETGHILLEGAPRNIDVTKLKRSLEALSPDIEDVHNVHVWQVKPGEARLTLHARISEGVGAQPILERVKMALAEDFGISDSTVQIEVGGKCPEYKPPGATRHARTDSDDVAQLKAQAAVANLRRPDAGDDPAQPA